MMKSTFLKAMLLGRATVYLVGLALMLAVVAPRLVKRQSEVQEHRARGFPNGHCYQPGAPISRQVNKQELWKG